MKEKIMYYIKTMKREQKIVFALLALLLVLLLLPVKQGTSDEKEEKKEQDQNGSDKQFDDNLELEQMEYRLEEALSKVEGVGEVQVVLTLESSAQKIVEKDRPSSKNQETQRQDQEETTDLLTESTEEDTVYEKDSQGNQIPFVVAETYPEIRGVLVICQGGDNPVVVQQISEGVMALFRLEAHKIKVMKMK